MLSLAAASLAFAAVALLAQRRRLAGASLLLVAATLLVLAWGSVRGLILFTVLAMAAPSVLVLLLPPRPHLARTVAVAGTLCGLAATGLGLTGVSS